ncbi:iron-sulfur cluster assembly scaffold protein [Mycoplasma sp. 1781]|uniref:iron-sulfur cluster assembly scaffold protein n=1 Tax=Mycoplasma sp. 125 TaxID=3447505 RepID=UPI003F655C52
MGVILLKSFSTQEKQQIIFNSYSEPKHSLSIPRGNGIKEHSRVCVDDIELNLLFENDKLIDAKYYATGCAIFISSVELMIDQVLNKDKSEILCILEEYFKLINREEQIDINIDLGKLLVFENVKVHLNRLECASIVYRAFKKGLNG